MVTHSISKQAPSMQSQTSEKNHYNTLFLINVFLLVTCTILVLNEGILGKGGGGGIPNKDSDLSLSAILLEFASIDSFL